jgi:predicted porin
MKKTIFAAAALVCVTGIAQAQTSVTLYGLIDNAIEYDSNANAAGNNVLRMTSGGMNTSRWGMRGTEDLGGGLKAVFQLESGIKTTTGALDDSTGLLFNRQANVGLEGSFGRVVMGRSFSTTYDALLPFDPMGYAPLYSWATSGNATAAISGGTVRKDGMLTGVSNMIKYQGEFNGFKLSAMYSLGGVAGSTSDSAKYGLGAGYANGPLSLVATFDQQNGTVAASGAYDKTTIWHLGAGYQIDNIKLLGAYRNYKKTMASGAADLRSDMWWGGVNYQATPQWNLTGAVYYQNMKNLAGAADNSPIMYVGRAKYSLSKTTDLYAMVAFAKAKNNGLVGISRDDAGFSSSQNGVAIGIQKRF